jgi:probable addiction module antidote protein
MKKPYITRQEFLQELLKDKENVRELLSKAVFEDPDYFRTILKDVIEATGGFSALSEKTKLSRTAIYHMVSPKGNPSLNSLVKVGHALGLTPSR